MTTLQATGLDEVRRRIADSSPQDVVAESLARGREIADLGAFIALADSADGGSGPLAGVPVAVKEHLDPPSSPPPGGPRALRQPRPGGDQHAVGRLRAAG